MTIAVQSMSCLLSLEAFLELPETKPASEYLHGRIEQKPMPQGKHSTLQELITLINQRSKPEKLAYALPKLRCSFAGHSIVPDIAVFEWQRIPLDKNGEIVNKISIAPDWMIEILSRQSSIKSISKLSFALQNNTQLGWLISPQVGYCPSDFKKCSFSARKSWRLYRLDYPETSPELPVHTLINGDRWQTGAIQFH